jgi:hypothetical protein
MVVTNPEHQIGEKLPKFYRPYIDITASTGEREEPAKCLRGNSQAQDGDGANVLCPRKTYSKSTIRLGKDV